MSQDEVEKLEALCDGLPMGKKKRCCMLFLVPFALEFEIRLNSS
jgi:hypothetical protein